MPYQQLATSPVPGHERPLNNGTPGSAKEQPELAPYANGGPAPDDRGASSPFALSGAIPDKNHRRLPTSPNHLHNRHPRDSAASTMISSAYPVSYTHLRAHETRH